MNNKTFLENDDQFIVSYELLYILQWLMMYEKEAFKHLVHKAFIQGSQSPERQDTYDQFEEAEYLQSSVVDFFSFLEEEVENVSQAESIKYIMQQNLLKTLDHIDPKIFDPAIIKASMMATAEKVNSQRNHLAKDLFLKELLKKWTPKKDKSKNKKHSLH
jgi:hypothetical protein